MEIQGNEFETEVTLTCVFDYNEGQLEVTSARLGNLKLTREQLIAAYGQQWLDDLESDEHYRQIFV